MNADERAELESEDGMLNTDEKEELKCDVEERETELREDLELEDGFLNADESS